MLEPQKLPPIPADIVIAEMEAYELGYLRCIKDILASDTWFLEFDGKLKIPLSKLTPEKIKNLLQGEK